MFLSENTTEKYLDDFAQELTCPQILVVIDMQNDFIDGVFGTEEAQSIVTDIADLVATYKSYGHPVIFTQDTHDAMSYDGLTESKYFSPHCVRGTWGWQISKAINTHGCKILEKGEFACTYLIEEINNYLYTFTNMPTHYPVIIQVVGLCTDICVISNVLMLQTMFPYSTIVLNSSLCAGTTPEKHLEALDVMKSNCIYVFNEDGEDTDDEDTDDEDDDEGNDKDNDEDSKNDEDIDEDIDEDEDLKE